MTIVRTEFAGQAMGVNGRFHNVVAWPESAELERCRGRIANQKFTAGREASDGGRVTVSVRFDDNCKNGHESFAITGNCKHADGGNSCGCIHEKIAETFPEFVPLIRFHLCDSDGPMHYPTNVLYLAGNRDCWGWMAGDPSVTETRIRFGLSPMSHKVGKNFAKFIKSRQGTGEFRVMGFVHEKDPKTYSEHFTLVGFGERWHECPFRSKQEAEEFAKALNTCKVEWLEHVTSRSEGKERELDSARRSAIWPEATDDELCADRQVLEGLLMDRLPALLEEFKATIEGFGFLYELPHCEPVE